MSAPEEPYLLHLEVPKDLKFNISKVEFMFFPGHTFASEVP